MIEALALPISMWVGDKVAGSGYDYLVDNINKEDLDAKFLKKVNLVSKNMQDKYPNILGGSVDDFFSQENILNELYKLLLNKSKVNIKTIHSTFDTNTLDVTFVKSFIKSLKKELLQDTQFNKILTNKELYQSTLKTNTNIENIKKNTELSTKELKKINKMLAVENSFELSDFLENYTKTTITNLIEINFIGLGLSANINRSRKRLPDIYVEPIFKLGYEKFQLKDIFSITRQHIVILGNPGSGKSTLTKYIMHNLLEKLGLFKKEVQNCIPFRIELRSYLKYKKENNGNILQYLSHILLQDNSLDFSYKILKENILEKVNTIIFFDGLDEIFDTTDKILIKNDIENITKLYSKLYTITTSRKIGYENAKFDDNYFCTFSLEDFEDNQIQHYLNKWYNCEVSDKDIIKEEILLFNKTVKEQSLDSELLKNPLFLSLIVIIFRNTHEIPNNKLEIYKSCTKTLVEKWDKNKKLNLDKNVVSKQDSIFANLAFWQYKELSNKNDISYRLVLNEVKNIINRLNISKEESEIESYSLNFLEYAEKRSLYFDNNFTHKTFLEYYTAYWIFQNFEKKGKFKERNKIIEEYSSNSFWFIVFELLFSLIDNEQADNEILDKLYTKHIKNKSSLPLLLYCLPNLSNISESIIKILFKESIFELIKNYQNLDYSLTDDKYDLAQIFMKLSNYPKYINLINTSFILNFEKIKQDDNLVYRLVQLYKEMFHYSHYEHKESNFPFAMSKKRLKKIRKKEYLVFSEYVFKTYEFKRFTKAIDLFGADKICESARCLYLSGQGFSSIMDALIDKNFERPETFQENFSYLINNYHSFYDIIIKYMDTKINLNSHRIKMHDSIILDKLISLLNEMNNDKLKLILLHMLIINILNCSIDKLLSENIISNIENPQYLEIINHTMTKGKISTPEDEQKIFFDKLKKLLDELK